MSAGWIARAEALIEGMQSDPDAEYVKVIEIDASTIRPMAALPNDPGNGVFIDELGDEPIRIDIAARRIDVLVDIKGSRER